MSERTPLEIETYGLSKAAGHTVTLVEEGIDVHDISGRYRIPWAHIASINATDRSSRSRFTTDWAVRISFKPGHKDPTPTPQLFGYALPKVKNIKEVVLVMNQWLGKYGSPSTLG
jgi:hypothetical protein